MVCFSLTSSHLVFLWCCKGRSRWVFSTSLRLRNRRGVSDPGDPLLSSPSFGSEITVVTFRRRFGQRVV